MTSSASTPSARAAVGTEVPWHPVEVDGVRLAVGDEGAGPALVCLHAIGHGGSDFARLRRLLASRWRVLTPDWPAQGHSGADHVPPSAGRYADLLVGVLDRCGARRAVLLGNSIGAAAAIRFAAAHPDRVAGLVLENPGGLDVPDRLARTVIRAMVRFFAAGAGGASWFGPAFAGYYRLVLQRGAAAAQRRRIVASAYEIAPVLRDAWASFGGPDADVRFLLPGIRCPVLFAWAARDQFVQLRRARPALRTLASARLATFPAGHAPHLESPDAFENELVRFLDRLDGAAPSASAQGPSSARGADRTTHVV